MAFRPLLLCLFALSCAAAATLHQDDVHDALATASDEFGASSVNQTPIDDAEIDSESSEELPIEAGKRGISRPRPRPTHRPSPPQPRPNPPHHNSKPRRWSKYISTKATRSFVKHVAKQVLESLIDQVVQDGYEAVKQAIAGKDSDPCVDEAVKQCMTAYTQTTVQGLEKCMEQFAEEACEMSD